MIIDVRKIISIWLVEHNYDGLTTDECGCELSDLMPCGEDSSNCVPGHKGPCPGPDACDLDGKCDWHMVSGPQR